MRDRAASVGGDRRPLGDTFFARPTALVARELVGALLVSDVDGVLTGGVIVETEAYLGADDPGSHAATKGVTARNRVMYGPPGRAYVYFTYGNHHMINLVTEADGIAGAVLVRAIEPTLGIDVMLRRRHDRGGRDLTNGPGKLAEALGVDLRHNGMALGGALTVFERERPADLVVTGRIGLSAGSDLPLRFCMRGNGYVSRGRTDHRPPEGGRGRTKGSA